MASLPQLNRGGRRMQVAGAAVLSLLISGGLAADDKKQAPAPHQAPPARQSAPAQSHQSAPAPTHTPSSGPAHTGAPAGGPMNHPSQQMGRPTPTNPSSTVHPATGQFPQHTGGQPQHTGGQPQHSGTIQPMSGTNRTSSSFPSNNSAARNTHTASPHIPPTPGGGRPMQRGGHEVLVRNNGRPSVVHTNNGMMIRRGPEGTAMRRTVVERSGHVYAFNRAGNGYVRSSYGYGGHQYAVRSYYVAGVAYPRYYRQYAYRGVFFDAYAPAFYYSPYYYGWAYRPWVAPVTFSWGWGRVGWFGYYGGYFTPYPVYASPNLWLTDYMVSQTLEAAYRERVESARAAQMQYSDQPPQQVVTLTPEIKQQIAEEVQRQLALESAEAQQRAAATQQQDPSLSGVGRILEDNKTHVLLSNANIDVTTTSGQECSISQGDAIGVYPGNNSAGETVQVRVLATAGGGCPANSVVSISIQDLQEMLNHVRATIDNGLAEMQKNKNLPRPPSSVPTATTKTEYAEVAPPPDPAEASELQRLNAEASKAEQVAVQDPGTGTANDPGFQTLPPSEPPPSGPPVQIATESGQSTELALGMTPEQVIARLGQPTNNVKVGPKQVFTYKGLGVKLTFTNGKLSAME